MYTTPSVNNRRIQKISMSLTEVYHTCYHYYMNHLKDLRIANGLRQSDLAMEAGCSRTAVMRMEQFCFPEPLPNVIAALSDITGESSARLANFYRSDVADHRHFSGQKWRLPEVTITDIYNTIADSYMYKYGELFEGMRKYWAARAGVATSQIAFCMAFSIHPAVLSKYESGATNHLPNGVTDALLGAGLPVQICDYLITSTEFNGVLSHAD